MPELVNLLVKFGNLSENFSVEMLHRFPGKAVSEQAR